MGLKPRFITHHKELLDAVTEFRSDIYGRLNDIRAVQQNDEMSSKEKKILLNSYFNALLRIMKFIDWKMIELIQVCREAKELIISKEIEDVCDALKTYNKQLRDMIKKLEKKPPISEQDVFEIHRYFERLVDYLYTARPENWEIWREICG